MTQQMANFLKEDLHESIEHKDNERLQLTMARAMSELVDCQFKTSERVKNIEVLIDRQKARMEGAQILWKVLKWTCALSGGAGAGWVIKALSVG